MASGALFGGAYQGGAHFEVFSPTGSDPTQLWKVCGGKAVKKVYDKSVKGNVYSIAGGPGCKMQLPKDERKGMWLVQPFLCLQFFLPPGQPISFELSVQDHGGTRRRLIFSSAFSEVKATPLHCQVPLTAVRRGMWLNLVLNVADIVAANFRGQELRAVELIALGAVCRLRKIFTLKQAPPVADAPGDGFVTGEPIPRQADFPPGVDCFTQLVDGAARGAEVEATTAVPQWRPLSEPSVHASIASGASGTPMLPADAAARTLSSTHPDYEGPMHLAFGKRFPVRTPGGLETPGSTHASAAGRRVLRPLSGVHPPAASPSRAGVAAPSNLAVDGGLIGTATSAPSSEASTPQRDRRPKPESLQVSQTLKNLTGSVAPSPPAVRQAPAGSSSLMRGSSTPGASSNVSPTLAADSLAGGVTKSGSARRRHHRLPSLGGAGGEDDPAASISINGLGNSLVDPMAGGSVLGSPAAAAGYSRFRYTEGADEAADDAAASSQNAEDLPLRKHAGSRLRSCRVLYQSEEHGAGMRWGESPGPELPTWHSMYADENLAGSPPRRRISPPPRGMGRAVPLPESDAPVAEPGLSSSSHFQFSTEPRARMGQDPLDDSADGPPQARDAAIDGLLPSDASPRRPEGLPPASQQHPALSTSFTVSDAGEPPDQDSPAAAALLKPPMLSTDTSPGVFMHETSPRQADDGAARSQQRAMLASMCASEVEDSPGGFGRASHDDDGSDVVRGGSLASSGEGAATLSLWGVSRPAAHEPTTPTASQMLAQKRALEGTSSRPVGFGSVDFVAGIGDDGDDVVTEEPVAMQEDVSMAPSGATSSEEEQRSDMQVSEQTPFPMAHDYNLQRAFTPPVITASQVCASPPRPRVVVSPTKHGKKHRLAGSAAGAAGGEVDVGEGSDDDGEQVDLLFDPILHLYYEPKANRFYELLDEDLREGDAAPL